MNIVSKGGVSEGYIKYIPMSSVIGLNDALDSKADAWLSASHINDASTDAVTNAPTNLSGLLIAALTGELNSANQRQNELATKYNDLATKFNDLVNKLETLTILAST